MNNKRNFDDVADYEKNGDDNIYVETPSKKRKKKKKKNIKDEEQLQSEEIELCPEIDISFTGEDSNSAKDGNEDSDIEWETADLINLVENLSKQLPKNDLHKFSTTLDKIDWESVSFGNHPPDECKNHANILLRKMRKFRTLTEVLSDAKVWAENPNRSLLNKRVKHPDRPKKPMTPYFRYFTEKRAKYQAENPELNNAELSKLIASHFSSLKEKKKAKYRRKYEEEMAEFRERNEKFRKDHPELFKVSNVRQKAETIGPEKPRKPFDLFLASRMKKYEGEDKKVAHEKIRESWNNLGEAKRIKWIKKSLKGEQRYQDEVNDYKNEHPDFKPPTLKSILNKQEIGLKHKFEGRPEKPPVSGYQLYSKFMLSELKDVPAKEKMVIIAKRWKELSAEEKGKYNQKAQKSQTKYMEKFDAYLQQLPEEEKEKVLSESKLKLPGEKKFVREKKSVREKVIQNAALSAFQMEEIIRLEKANPNMNKGELIVTVNKNWEQLNDEDKGKYVQIAQSLKDFLPGRTKEKRERSRKDLGEIRFSELSGISRPAKNGFGLFCTEMMATYKTIPPNGRMKFAANIWKNEKSQEERDAYSEKAKRASDIFVEQLRKYKETGELPKKKSNAPPKGILKNVKAEVPEVNVQPTTPAKSAYNFLYKESSGSDSD